MNRLADNVVDILVQVFSDQLGELILRTAQRASRAPPILIWIAIGGTLGFLLIGGAAFACFLGKLELMATWLVYGAFLSAVVGILAMAAAILVGGNDI